MHDWIEVCKCVNDLSKSLAVAAPHPAGKGINGERYYVFYKRGRLKSITELQEHLQLLIKLPASMIEKAWW